MKTAFATPIAPTTIVDGRQFFGKWISKQNEGTGATGKHSEVFHVSFHTIVMNFCLVAMHFHTSMAPTPDPVQPVLFYYAVAQRACRVPHHHATTTRITDTATVALNG
jgi:hypothetical protein